MDRAGVVPARRTASGRRYGLRTDLDRYLGTTAAERSRRGVCYGRVSSPEQRPDGNKQRRIVEESAIAKGMANLEFVEEMGGGLDGKAAPVYGSGGFRCGGRTCDACRGPPGPVGALWLRATATSVRKPGDELLALNPEKASPEPERVQDWMAIPHGFSSR